MSQVIDLSKLEFYDFFNHKCPYCEAGLEELDDAYSNCEDFDNPPEGIKIFDNGKYFDSWSGATILEWIVIFTCPSCGKESWMDDSSG